MAGAFTTLAGAVDFHLQGRQLLRTNWIYDGRSGYGPGDLALIALADDEFQLWMYNGTQLEDTGGGAARPAPTEDTPNGWILVSAGGTDEETVAAASLYQDSLKQFYPEGAEIIHEGIVYRRSGTDGTVTAPVPAGNTFWTVEGSVGSGHLWHNINHYVTGDIVDQIDGSNQVIYIAIKENGLGVTYTGTQPAQGGGTEPIPDGPKDPAATVNQVNHFYVYPGTGSVQNHHFWRVAQAGLLFGTRISDSDTVMPTGVATVVTYEDSDFTSTEYSPNRVNIALKEDYIPVGNTETLTEWDAKSAQARLASDVEVSAVSAVQKGLLDNYSVASTDGGLMTDPVVNTINLPTLAGDGSYQFDSSGNLLTTRHLIPGGATLEPPGNPTASASETRAQYSGINTFTVNFNVDSAATEHFSALNAPTISDPNNVVVSSTIQYFDRDGTAHAQASVPQDDDQLVRVRVLLTVTNQNVGTATVSLTGIEVSNANVTTAFDDLTSTLTYTAATKPQLRFSSVPTAPLDQFETVAAGYNHVATLSIVAVPGGLAGAFTTGSTVAKPIVTIAGVAVDPDEITELTNTPTSITWNLSNRVINDATAAAGANDIEWSSPAISAQTAGSTTVDQIFDEGTLTTTLAINRIPNSLNAVLTAPSSDFVSIYDESTDRLTFNYNHTLNPADGNYTFGGNDSTGSIFTPIAVPVAGQVSITYSNYDFGFTNPTDTRTITNNGFVAYDDNRDAFYDITTTQNFTFFVPHMIVQVNGSNTYDINGTQVTGITLADVSGLQVPSVTQGLEDFVIGEATDAAVNGSLNSPYNLVYPTGLTTPTNAWLIVPDYVFSLTDSHFLKFVMGGMDLPGSVQLINYVPSVAKASQAGIGYTTAYSVWALGAFDSNTSFRISPTA